MIRRLALNFRKYNESELDELAMNICKRMIGSEHFPEYQTLLEPIHETAKQFQQYRRESAHGDTQMILIKNDRKERLISLLQELGELVDRKANGDELYMVRSGFDFAKPTKKINLEQPEEFQ